jgi:hypothetical protein
MFVEIAVKRCQVNSHYLRNDGTGPYGPVTWVRAQDMPKVAYEGIRALLKNSKQQAGGDREDFKRLVRMLA